MSVIDRIFEIKVLDYSQVRNRNGKTYVPTSGNRNKIDILPEIPCRVLFKRAKNYEQAKRWGDSFGTVVYCQKIDISYYLAKIEHLNVVEKPIELEIDTGEFVLNKAMEITQPRRKTEHKKISLEILDKQEEM